MKTFTRFNLLDNSTFGKYLRDIKIHLSIFCIIYYKYSYNNISILCKK